MIAIQKNYLVRSRIELESEWQRFYLFIEPGEKELWILQERNYS